MAVNGNEERKGNTHLVHLHVDAFALVVVQDDAHGLVAAFTLDEHSVAAEQLQSLHLRRRQTNDGVVVVGG